MRLASALAAVALLLVGCSSAPTSEEVTDPTPYRGTPDVRPRSFQMGMSSLPPQLTDQGYEATFELVGSASDVVLIQRTPPWSELAAGDISPETVAITRREVDLARKHGLDIFIAIDPTDATTGRAELAALPSELAGQRFGDEGVRDALTHYAQFVATNYDPKYLAFGVEINAYQRSHPDDFERFVTLYHEAYRAVKDISPDTLMFPTFQLEELQGYLPLDAPKPTQWNLLSRFTPAMDMLAVSSYPRSVFPSVDNLPADYFEQLTRYTDKPIAIVSTGYPSAPAADDSTEALQSTYMLRLLNYVQELKMSMVVWFVSQDGGSVDDPAFQRLRYLGLRRQDGTAKPAWEIWRTVSRRPIVTSP